MNENLFLDALACRNTSRPPIWMMRQAGRHLPSYRAIRQRYSFLEMCHSPDLIEEITLLPIKTYDLDAAILFSDILVVPEAMGMGLRFEDKIGPLFENPLSNELQINKLSSSSDLSKLQFVADGISRLRKSLSIPLIGFCGAPFTVASYMIEGRSSPDLKKTKQWMFQNPASFHRLLQKITDWSIAYLQMQIQAGVQAIQLFDSWANSLAHYQFREFCLPYLKKILEGIRPLQIPSILFCRGSSVFAEQLSELNPSAISLDWNCKLSDVRKKISPLIALQGNLDPHILYAPISKIEEEANRLMNEMEGDQGFIFNLGHGIFPDVSQEAVQTLVSCVKRRAACPAILSS